MTDQSWRSSRAPLNPAVEHPARVRDYLSAADYHKHRSRPVISARYLQWAEMYADPPSSDGLPADFEIDVDFS